MKRLFLMHLAFLLCCGVLYGQASITLIPNSIGPGYSGSLTITGTGTNFAVATMGMNLRLTNVNSGQQYNFGNAPSQAGWWSSPTHVTPIYSMTAPITLPANAPLGNYNAQLTGFGFFGQNYSHLQNNAIFVGYNPATFAGKLIIDRDSNCVQGGTDLPLANRIITVTPGPYYAMTDAAGAFSISLTPGTYTFAPPTIPGTLPLCPVSGTASITNNQGNTTVSGIDFYLKSSGLPDLESSLALGPHRPGFTCWGTATVNNFSSNPATNVQVKVVKPSSFSFQSASTAFPSTTNGDTLTWTLGTVQPYTSINLTYNCLVPWNTPINTVFQYLVLVTSSTQESSVANNTTTEPFPITGSYDPNDKRVWTVNGDNADGPILPTDSLLRYMIRFQNTGTDTAFNIRVRDTFDLDLDMGTLRIEGTSHPCQVLMTDSSGKNLEFFFQNILLVDSNHNEPLSHGFVEYTIRKKNNLANGTLISNTASIYFDFNLPVVTNTVNSRICPALPTAFTETSSALVATFTGPTTGMANSWIWDFGDGQTAFGANTSHTYATGGTYNVCLYIANSCGRSDTICQTVTVACAPVSAGFSAQNPTANDVQFTNSATGAVTSYAWDFGDGGTGSFVNGSHTYAAAGLYTVCLIVTNACAESDTSCQQIAVGCSSTQASFNHIATGLTTAYVNLSAGPNNAYLWSFGDGSTSTSQNPTHTFAAPGSYNVCLQVTNICNDTSSTCSTVTVTCSAPVAAYSHSANLGVVTFTDQTVGNPTAWLWNFGDGGTSTLQNPVHAYTASGTYQACMTVTDTCGTDDQCETLTISLTQTDDPLLAELYVYPNPSSANAELVLSTTRLASVAIRMLDAQGKEVYRRAIDSLQGELIVSLPTSQLAAGCYLIQVSVEDEIRSLRFQKLD